MYFLAPDFLWLLLIVPSLLLLYLWLMRREKKLAEHCVNLVAVKQAMAAGRRGKSLDDKAKPGKKEVTPVAPGSYESAAIILLTDGRRTTGIDTEEASKMAADRGVRVYSVGLGTVDGAVPAYDSWTAVYMKLDEPSLRAVAEKTLAEYFYARDAEALKKVYAKLSSRIPAEKKATELSALLALMAAGLSIAAAALSLLWFGRIV